MCEDAASFVVGLQRDLLQIVSLHASHAVVPSQAAIQKRELGIDQVRDTQVAVHHRLQVTVSFIQHGLLHHDVKVSVEPPVWLGEVDQAQVQPLVSQILHELLAAFIVQHASDLFADLPLLFELSTLCSGKEFIVRHRVPQEVAES